MKNFSTRLKAALIFAVIYTLLITFLIGWRGDHTFFISFIVVAILVHQKSYNFVIVLSAFALFWISYDFMRIYPNYLLNDVHVIDLYNLELKFFGVWDGGSKVILSEWFTSRTNPFLTLFAGVSYLLWVPGPIIYTLFLATKDKSQMVRFSYAFLLTNFIGFVIYYLYPAAPPWYYINYGSATDFSIPGSEALLANFDTLINFPLFHGIYAKNANVFAAVPSLHAAYPVLSLLFAIKFKDKLFIIFFSVLSFGIWFAAVYSQHHYFIDLLLGLLCAVGAYFLIKWLATKKFFLQFEKFLSNQIG